MRPPSADGSADDAGRRLEQLARAVFRPLDAELAVDEQARGLARFHEAIAASDALGRPRRWLVAVAAGLALVGASAALPWLLPDRPLTYATAGTEVTGAGYVHPTSGKAVLVFSEGSEIRLASGARGRIARIDGKGAALALESGGARLHIVKRPGARWSVECGPYTVRVTGTEFSVTWSAVNEALEVDVTEGGVQVFGPNADGGITVARGQRLAVGARSTSARVDATAAPREASPSLPARVAAEDSSPVSNQPREEPAGEGVREHERRADGPSSWTRWVEEGDYRRVLAEADQHVTGCLRRCSSDDLLALGDAARLDRRSQLAERSLRGVRARFPHSRQASTAAFLLARLSEDVLRSPAGAVEWYGRYLAEWPGGPLAAEADGRRMVALRGLAHSAEARAAAEAYLRRFPTGQYAAAAKEIVTEK